MLSDASRTNCDRGAWIYALNTVIDSLMFLKRVGRAVVLCVIASHCIYMDKTSSKEEVRKFKMCQVLSMHWTPGKSEVATNKVRYWCDDNDKWWYMYEADQHMPWMPGH